MVIRCMDPRIDRGKDILILRMPNFLSQKDHIPIIPIQRVANNAALYKALSDEVTIIALPVPLQISIEVFYT